MSDISRAIKLARSIIDAILEGRLQAKDAQKLSDDELLTYDKQVYAEWVGERERREALLNENNEDDG